MKKLRPLFSLLLTAAILFLAVSPARAASGEDPVPTSWDCVMLFAKKDLKGGYRAFLPGEYPDVGVRSASIYLPSDCTVTAFSGKNFTGTKYELRESQSAFLRYDFGLGVTYISGIGSMIVHRIESAREDITDLTDAGKNELMIRYAPRIWMAEGDPYEACSMEYVFEHFEKSVDKNGEGRLSTVQKPSSPFEILPVYYGRQADAKGYAFWIEKDGGYVDVSYFQYCPFDSGKYIDVIRHMAGAHPGDWEHVTLRLLRETENGRTYLRPVKVAFPAHTFAALQSWEDLNKIDGTHIEIYCAAGSHGMYPTEGDHVYVDLKPLQQLVDVCYKGEAWDLWLPDKLETFEHDPETGSRALAGSPWAYLFGYDTGENSRSVKNWGNRTYFPIFLGGGPQGPQYKTELHARDTFK